MRAMFSVTDPVEMHTMTRVEDMASRIGLKILEATSDTVVRLENGLKIIIITARGGEHGHHNEGRTCS